MSRFSVVVVCLAMAVAANVVAASVVAEPASAGTVWLTPPVDSPVLDPFRLPDGPYGPGNRGIEYDTDVGTIVRAAADGVVAFAGQVGGSLFVSIEHSGGLRSTSGFVGDVLVSRGARVRRGQPVATAEGPFHFTVRIRGVYVDPAGLFGRAQTSVRLVAHRSGGIPFSTAGLTSEPDTLLDGPFGPRTTPPRSRRNHWVRATPGRLGVPHEHATGKEETPRQSSP